MSGGGMRAVSSAQEPARNCLCRRLRTATAGVARGSTPVPRAVRPRGRRDDRRHRDPAQRRPSGFRGGARTGVPSVRPLVLRPRRRSTGTLMSDAFSQRRPALALRPLPRSRLTPTKGAASNSWTSAACRSHNAPTPGFPHGFTRRLTTTKRQPYSPPGGARGLRDRGGGPGP